MKKNKLFLNEYLGDFMPFETLFFLGGGGNGSDPHFFFGTIPLVGLLRKLPLG